MRRSFKEKTLSILMRSILLGSPVFITPHAFAAEPPGESDEFKANWGLSIIGAQAAYDKGYTGKGVAVGVNDGDFPDGIHELVDKVTYVTPTAGGTEHTQNLSIGNSVSAGFNAENYNHGAHVSGIIAAKKDDQGMHGVAYNADIYAQNKNNNIYSFLDSTPVRVINNSWGREGERDYGIDPENPVYKDLVGIDGTSVSSRPDFKNLTNKNTPTETLNSLLSPTSKITVKEAVDAVDGIVVRNGIRYNVGSDKSNKNGGINQIRAIKDAAKQGVVNVFSAGNFNYYNEPGTFQGLPIVYPELLPNYLTVSNLTLVRSEELKIPDGTKIIKTASGIEFMEVDFQGKKYLRQTNLAPGQEDYLWERSGTQMRSTQILVNDGATKETLFTGSSQCGYTALWCVAAPGTGIYSSTFKVEDGKLADNYEYMTGTSMAAPHATGALAVLMERFPYMTSDQVTSVLKTTAVDMDENGVVTDGSPKKIDKYFGWGKISLENGIKGPAMFASAEDVKSMLTDDVKTNLGDDLDKLADTFGNGDFHVNMGEGVKYDTGTSRERSCDAKECTFDTWSNDISGSGGLIKQGDGTLQLSGNNSFKGNTQLNEGGIDITGSVSSDIIVNNAGTLSGQGQSGNIEINGGKFTPSRYNQNGFSTFTINGDIKFSPDATYSVKIKNENEQVDKLVVRGNAFLNDANFQTYEQTPDKLLEKNDVSRYQGHEYTLIDAQKINGIFNSNYLNSIATADVQPELAKSEEDKKLKLQFKDLAEEKAAADKAAADKAAADKAAADQAAADKAAADKAAADKAAADKAAADKAAADKAAADKAAADKVAADKAAADKAAADKVAADKAAADKAAADKVAEEKAAADKAAADKAAADKAAVDKAAADKAAADKVAADKAAADKAAADKAAADKAAADKVAADKAAADKVAEEKAAADKVAADKAAEEKAAADKAAADKAAADKVAADKAAEEKAAADKAAADKAAADKAAADKVAADKAAADKAAADKAAEDKATAEEKIAIETAAAEQKAAEERAMLLQQAKAEKAARIASIHGDILSEELHDMDRSRRLINQRLRHAQRNENNNNVWIDFTDSDGKSRSNESGAFSNILVHNYDVQTHGFAFGADTTVDHWTLGLMGSVNYKDIDNKNEASAKVDNYQLGLYTGVSIDQINLRLSGVMGRNEIKSKFNDADDGQFTAKYNGRTWQANAEIGYVIQYGSLSFEPVLGLSYDYVKNNDFSQSNGFYSLDGEEKHFDRLSSIVGLDVSKKWVAGENTTLSLNGGLAWQNTLKHTGDGSRLTFVSNNDLISGAVGSVDVPDSKNAAITNIGFHVGIANTHDFSVNYEGQFSEKYNENGVRLRYEYKF
ncbi:S8 family serine peptidase [Acinetobacter sp. WZC-1]|uniref:S8 family serine peptidase n=1 Tax=Acinetobacter sp. WZC-1 TaxID=3459034 RepID=UPI00403DB61A